MNEPTQEQDNAVPAASEAISRVQLKAAFSPDTPDEIRERVLDAVFAVLNGNDDD